MPSRRRKQLRRSRQAIQVSARVLISSSDREAGGGDDGGLGKEVEGYRDLGVLTRASIGKNVNSSTDATSW
jgi:hypothetical protein